MYIYIFLWNQESDLQDHVMNICTETLVQSSYYTSVDMYQATPPAVYNNPNNPNNPDSMHINASCPDHNNPSNPSSPSSPSNPYQAEWFPRKELHNRSMDLITLIILIAHMIFTLMITLITQSTLVYIYISLV